MGAQCELSAPCKHGARQQLLPQTAHNLICHISVLFLRCLSCQCCCVKTLHKLLGDRLVMHAVASDAETANGRNKKRGKNLFNLFLFRLFPHKYSTEGFSYWRWWQQWVTASSGRSGNDGISESLAFAAVLPGVLWWRKLPVRAGFCRQARACAMLVLWIGCADAVWLVGASMLGWSVQAVTSIKT